MTASNTPDQRIDEILQSFYEYSYMEAVNDERGTDLDNRMTKDAAAAQLRSLFDTICDEFSEYVPQVKREKVISKYFGGGEYV